jgi:hypothetical protein
LQHDESGISVFGQIAGQQVSDNPVVNQISVGSVKEGVDLDST